MKIIFNNAKKGVNEIEIESYSEQDGELWIYLYTNDYNAIKSLVYGTDKTDITLDKGNSTLNFINYIDVTSFSSVVDEIGRDYISISLKQNIDSETKENLLAEIERLKNIINEQKKIISK